jgi:hypothetical protein
MADTNVQASTDPVVANQNATPSDDAEKSITFKESELKALLQSESDRMTQKGITSALANARAKWEKELEEQKAEAARLAKMDEATRANEILKKVEQELADERHKNRMSDIERSAVDFMGENKIDVRLKKFVMAGDEESTVNNVKEMHTLIEEMVAQRVSEKFKSSGSAVVQGANVPAGGSVQAQLEAQYEEAMKAKNGDAMLYYKDQLAKLRIKR